jgi:hypothetical protein
MAVFGSVEEKSVPWLKEFCLQATDKDLDSHWEIAEFIFTEKGCLITNVGDNFNVFLFKAQGLHRKLKAHLNKSIKSKTDIPRMAIQIDDFDGSYSIIEMKELGYVDSRTTASGNEVRTIRPIG